MQGVITHASNPKRNTACTITLKKIPDTCSLDLSCPKIIENCAHLFLEFLRFPTTTGQSFSKAVKIQTSYLNDVTKFSGRP